MTIEYQGRHLQFIAYKNRLMKLAIKAEEEARLFGLYCETVHGENSVEKTLAQAYWEEANKFMEKIYHFDEQDV